MSLPLSPLSQANRSDFSIANGWLSPIQRRCPSPNANERPDAQDISLLVIHNISLPPAQFGDDYIEQFFCNRLPVARHPYFKGIAKLQVSSHLLLKRTGQVVQFVPFTNRAWHAGASRFDGRDNCNDFAIGIELEGTDDIPYTRQQYQQLAGITQAIMAAYPAITRERIVGHNTIAPERKTDPGPAFNWSQFFALLEGQSA